MLASEIGELQAKVVPYKNFKQRMTISRLEEQAGRRVTWDGDNVYSFPRKPITINGASRNFTNLKCHSCSNVFRIITLHDVQWSICPRCGGANVERPSRGEEIDFENRIK